MLRGLACALVVLALGACGSSTPPPVSDMCTASTTAIVDALARAPQAVTLRDGTRLSSCLRNADSDGELQEVGTTFSQAAERLRTRAEAGDRHAALALGFLAGAARAGAEHTQGVGIELQRRVELVAGRVETNRPALAPVIEDGVTAGRERG